MAASTCFGRLMEIMRHGLRGLLRLGQREVHAAEYSDCQFSCLVRMFVDQLARDDHDVGRRHRLEFLIIRRVHVGAEQFAVRHSLSDRRETAARRRPHRHRPSTGPVPSRWAAGWRNCNVLLGHALGFQQAVHCDLGDVLAATFLPRRSLKEAKPGTRPASLVAGRVVDVGKEVEAGVAARHRRMIAVRPRLLNAVDPAVMEARRSPDARMT